MMQEWEVQRGINLKWIAVAVVLAGIGIGFLAAFMFGRTSNRPPSIVSTLMPPGGVANVGSPVTVGVRAFDPDGDALAYSWHCERDPLINTKSENEFVWTPSSTGTYRITVSVSDGMNPPVTYSMEITVAASGVPPVAVISGPSEARVGSEVYFSSTGSGDPDGVIVEYRWSFGDGSTGSGREVTHTYANPGTFNVSLTVVDNTGLEDTAVLVIEVSEHPSPPYDVEALYIPSGWMGDYGDIFLDTACTTNPLSGDTCIKIVYTPSGSQGWAGIYWQYPEQNWGDYPGHDLTGATKLTFWARGEHGGEKSEFKVGGILESGKPYRDSIYPAVTTGVLVLSSSWQKYTINLSGRDLSSVIGGFCWVTNRTGNPSGCTIYLDNMLFEA